MIMDNDVDDPTMWMGLTHTLALVCNKHYSAFPIIVKLELADYSLIARGEARD